MTLIKGKLICVNFVASNIFIKFRLSLFGLMLPDLLYLNYFGDLRQEAIRKKKPFTRPRNR